MVQFRTSNKLQNSQLIFYSFFFFFWFGRWQEPSGTSFFPDSWLLKTHSYEGLCNLHNVSRFTQMEAYVIPIRTIKIDYQMFHCHLKFLCELQCLCRDLFLLLPLISHFLVFLWLTTNPRLFLTNSILASYLLYSTRFHQIPPPIVFRPGILIFQGLALNLRSFCFSSPKCYNHRHALSYHRKEIP